MLSSALQASAKSYQCRPGARLFREHGYVGTALSDVVTESAAPRGSMYFHFPGGKEELATEVTLLHCADLMAHIHRAAGVVLIAVAGLRPHGRNAVRAARQVVGCS